MRRLLMASLVVTVAVMSSGCYEFNQFVHRPFGPGTLCDATHCDGCGPRFGPTYGCGELACCEPRCSPSAGCGGACGMAPECGVSCEPACDGCGHSCGGPLQCILSIFHPVKWTGCYNNGCGEIYWGDFHSDPPDCCDPCNCMGDYTGCNNSGCASCCGQSGTSYGIPSTEIGPEPSEGRPTRAPAKPAPKLNPYAAKRYNAARQTRR